MSDWAEPGEARYRLLNEDGEVVSEGSLEDATAEVDDDSVLFDSNRGSRTELICPLCAEAILRNDAWMPLGSLEGPRIAHRECMLREVMGGIGHLIAHDYWCTQMHDPDAGLTRRQSALLADTFVTVMGVDEAARRA